MKKVHATIIVAGVFAIYACGSSAKKSAEESVADILKEDSIARVKEFQQVYHGDSALLRKAQREEKERQVRAQEKKDRDYWRSVGYDLGPEAAY